MKRIIKSLAFVALFVSYCLPSWGQAPTTEGKDFWVTFLRADGNAPSELRLTVSSKTPCTVTIENPNKNFRIQVEITAANSTAQKVIDKSYCYSSDNTGLTYTALHVYSDKEFSLFAGNYKNKSFDAANILPTAALMDDYLIQTYPASDHDNAKDSSKPKPQGSHFAIVAVEDGTTVVDYTPTVKANGQTGPKQVSLQKGQVCYVWTGESSNSNPNDYDLSGTTVKAQNGKKIAVFQGCPHTNVPYLVRNRDHLFTQAMPTAYWGTEFGITSSLLRRRDIVAVMALNDHTEVYINNADGDPELVHTFNFNSSDPQESKQYWTFEIGEYTAYCNSEESPYNGKLIAPDIVGSSCFLTTSCPVGVHLIMASNRYDLPTSDAPEPDSDPALLWISPIEQVIKEINFATYNQGINTHYVNIVTATADVANMTCDGNSIDSHFQPISGNSDYSFARLTVDPGAHNLKGSIGFVAHVYGYGEKASYAYSCGSSTIQRSITFNGTPLEIDSTSTHTFCENEEIKMVLGIGSNEYTSVHWDFGDGCTYDTDPNASNEEKKVAYHTYTTPGWYDMEVIAKYTDKCSGIVYDSPDPLHLRFKIGRADTIRHTVCVDEDYIGPEETTEEYNCDSVVVTRYYRKSSSPGPVQLKGNDSYTLHGVTYTTSTTVEDTLLNAVYCDSIVTYEITIIKCLDLQIENKPVIQQECFGKDMLLPFSYSRDAEYGNAYLCKVIPDSERGYRLIDTTLLTIKTGIDDGDNKIDTLILPTSTWDPGHYVGCILMEDANCLDDQGNRPLRQSTALNLTVRYPDSVFVFRFNNVLAVRQDMGDFVAYQWYHKGVDDAEFAMIDPNNNPSAITSVFHTREKFTKGDKYYVELTERDKQPLATCAFTVPDKLEDYEKTSGEENTDNPDPNIDEPDPNTDEPDPNTEEPDPNTDEPDPNTEEPNPNTDDEPQASKKFFNNRICVELDGRIYDMYGQRVK